MNSISKRPKKHTPKYVALKLYCQSQKTTEQMPQKEEKETHKVATTTPIKWMKKDKEVNDETSFCIIAVQISHLLTFKRHIPNLFTLTNLLLGLIAIGLTFSGFIVLASYCILLASLFDFLDGFMARILKASSELGKQLDSLADLVSFGVAPSFIACQIFVWAGDEQLISNYLQDVVNKKTTYFLPFIALLIPLFSALRLALFNINENSASFVGLPTPANALFYISIPLAVAYQNDHLITQLLLQQEVFSVVVILLSGLMIAKLECLSLKLTSYDWSSNQWRYIFMLMSLLLILIFHFVAVPIIILLYLLFSLFNTIKK